MLNIMEDLEKHQEYIFTLTKLMNKLTDEVYKLTDCTSQLEERVRKLETEKEIIKNGQSSTDSGTEGS